MKKEFTFRGFTFSDERQLMEAKKEAEAVDYLRAKTDFDDVNRLMKLYNRLLDRQMMETKVGIAFLEEIRQRLLTSDFFTEDQIRPVPELREETRRMENRRKKRDASLAEKYYRQLVVTRLICVFLAVLVVGMFVIALTGRRSPLAYKYEEELLNKYASWAEELQRKENSLNDRLFELRQQGIEIPGVSLPGEEAEDAPGTENRENMEDKNEEGDRDGTDQDTGGGR